MEKAIGLEIGSVTAIQDDAATTDDIVLGKVSTYSGKLVSATAFNLNGPHPEIPSIPGSSRKTAIAKRLSDSTDSPTPIKKTRFVRDIEDLALPIAPLPMDFNMMRAAAKYKYRYNCHDCSSHLLCACCPNSCLCCFLCCE